MNGPDRRGVEEFLYELLETEIGGVQVYEKAVELAINRDLKREFAGYLAETREHIRIATRLLKSMGLDPEAEVPGRIVVRFMGNALVQLMETAEASGDPASAERVACEAVVEAESKDQFNWELLGKLTRELEGSQADEFRNAHKEVQSQENEHLYHSKGWLRELWLERMGLPSLLPPPEERMHVKSGIGAAVAKTFAIRRRLGSRSRSSR